MPWVIGALVLLLVFGGSRMLGDDDKTPAQRGRDAPDGGYLAVPPTQIAAEAGVDVDVMTGGRIIRSEAGGAHENERAATLWVALNQVRRWETSLTEGACRGNKGPGYYGAQNAGGRWISTRQSAHADDLALADSIVSTGYPNDPTGGATKFLHVSAQEALHERDPARYKAAAAVIADWLADGYQPREVPPVSPARFLVFVRGGGLAA